MSETENLEVPSLVCVVLTYNEAVNVGHCLESALDLGPIVVVDSGSTDETRGICTKYTQNFLVHSYRNHAEQWQWALSNLPVKADWILALDADYVVSPSLARAIKTRLSQVPKDVAAIYVRHIYRFGGGDIRFGGIKGFRAVLVRPDMAQPDLSDLVDFRFNFSGRTEEWREPVIEYNRHDDDFSVWLQKQDKFSLRLAVETELRQRKLLGWEGRPNLGGNPDERMMWMRDVFLRFPLFARGFAYFLYRYVVRLGFLDGRAGFLYHFLQGWWLRTAIDWKIVHLRRLKLSDSELLSFRDAMLAVRSGSIETVLGSIRPADTVVAE